MLEHFQERIHQVLDDCESSGWGFPEAMREAYEIICESEPEGDDVEIEEEVYRDSKKH